MLKSSLSEREMLVEAAAAAWPWLPPTTTVTEVHEVLKRLAVRAARWLADTDAVIANVVADDVVFGHRITFSCERVLRSKSYAVFVDGDLKARWSTRAGASRGAD